MVRYLSGLLISFTHRKSFSRKTYVYPGDLHSHACNTQGKVRRATCTNWYVQNFSLCHNGTAQIISAPTLVAQWLIGRASSDTRKQINAKTIKLRGKSTDNRLHVGNHSAMASLSCLEAPPCTLAV